MKLTNSRVLEVLSSKKTVVANQHLGQELLDILEGPVSYENELEENFQVASELLGRRSCRVYRWQGDSV